MPFVSIVVAKILIITTLAAGCFGVMIVIRRNKGFVGFSLQPEREGSRRDSAPLLPAFGQELWD